MVTAGDYRLDAGGALQDVNMFIDNSSRIRETENSLFSAASITQTSRSGSNSTDVRGEGYLQTCLT